MCLCFNQHVPCHKKKAMRRCLGSTANLPQALEKLFLNGGFQGSDAMSLGLPAVEDSLLLLLNVDQLRAAMKRTVETNYLPFLRKKICSPQSECCCCWWCFFLWWRRDKYSFRRVGRQIGVHGTPGCLSWEEQGKIICIFRRRTNIHMAQESGKSQPESEGCQKQHKNE